jgi:hypothetical protein
VAGVGKADATSAFGRDAGTVDGREAGIGTCNGTARDASTGEGVVVGMGSRPGQDVGAGASRTPRGALGGPTETAAADRWRNSDAGGV